jgi:hypothetical protein
MHLVFSELVPVLKISGNTKPLTQQHLKTKLRISSIYQWDIYIFNGGIKMAEQRVLEARVLEQLYISATGVDQYMKLKLEKHGDVLVFPSPSFAGLHAQATTRTDTAVKAQYVGKTSSGKNWAILLDTEGHQYGREMDYGNLGIGTTPQIIYVGQHADFPRGRVNSRETPKKRTMVVN